ARHGRSLLLRMLGHHGLGRDHETSNRRGVLQRDAHDLRRVDDAGAQHVDILLGLGVEAVSLGLVLGDLADHDRAFDAGVFNDLADRRLERPEHNVDAGLDVGILVAQLADRGLGAQERHSASWHDAFFNGRLRRVHRVVDPILLFLDLDLCRTADADHRDPAPPRAKPARLQRAGGRAEIRTPFWSPKRSIRRAAFHFPSRSEPPTSRAPSPGSVRASGGAAWASIYSTPPAPSRLSARFSWRSALSSC